MTKDRPKKMIEAFCHIDYDGSSINLYDVIEMTKRHSVDPNDVEFHCHNEDYDYYLPCVIGMRLETDEEYSKRIAEEDAKAARYKAQREFRAKSKQEQKLVAAKAKLEKLQLEVEKLEAKHAETEEFKECESCAAKPGSPLLCDDCLTRRKAHYVTK